MGRPSDRDTKYMRQAHGTTRLITDYGVMETAKQGIAKYRRALQALADGDPASIRNAEDYDDWAYGTEPIPGDSTWTIRKVE